jgi:general secretion pathway protein D
VNFVFDKDVRSDAKVSIYLKDVSIDDALKVILSTQQLDRKLLNESTVLVYPNTQAKQREHQELTARSFYLTNADVKQAQNLIRTIAKSRDMFVDERLNLLVVRDTPEVLQLIERLIAALDLPEPEVVLEVEVMEIASNQLDELGIQWPDQIQYGITGLSGQVELGQRNSFRASITNPAVVATLRDTTSRGNVLANPRLRARNHEKAKVWIGEKLPVFTTQSTANVGVSASVSYIDVGLKLDVEPSVQLDNDVVMKVNLEVSTLIGRVQGPQGSVAYQVGTRQATTSLRLRDGETQILAGLIRAEDQKSIIGVPGLAQLPLLGRLFGVHSDQRVKTEVVLLITPRVVRNIGLPDASITSIASGVDGSPGAGSARLSRRAQVSVPLSGAGAGAIAGGAVTAGQGGQAPAVVDQSALLVLSTSGQVAVGETVAVTLQNRSAATIRGELEFDTALLQSSQSGEKNVGRTAFNLAPGGEQVFLLRALPAAEGQTVDVAVVGLSGSKPDGSSPAVRVEGDGFVTVSAP